VRVSAVHGSAHYSRNAFVKLDGRPMSFAIEADDVEGWVDVADIKAAAALPKKPLAEVARKRLRGFVEIELAP
jgi:hypothetical protein